LRHYIRRRILPWQRVTKNDSLAPLAADWMFSVGYAAEAAWNDTHWKHDRFNKLLLEARGELDDAKRHELYFEM